MRFALTDTRTSARLSGADGLSLRRYGDGTESARVPLAVSSSREAVVMPGITYVVEPQGIAPGIVRALR